MFGERVAELRLRSMGVWLLVRLPAVFIVTS